MKGDFARMTFDPAAHFSRVLLQQGRVLLEADFNEQSAITNYLMRCLITDIVGRRWAADSGFAIEDLTTQVDFVIRAGRYYVDGLVCENDKDCGYRTQPLWPTPESAVEIAAKPLCVYLDCWERHVSCVEEPRLREIALGGPDTSTRIQTAWQVRLLTQSNAKAMVDPLVAVLKARLEAPEYQDDVPAIKDTLNGLTSAMQTFANKPEDCAAAQALLDRLDTVFPSLAARARRQQDDDEPCSISPDAQYRGYENQLYRLEIHDGGNAEQATFKWSRENGSVAFRVLNSVANESGGETFTMVTLERLGPDRRYGLCVGDWVELTDDDAQLTQSVWPLLQVAAIDRHRRNVTLKGGTVRIKPSRNGILRRWDQAGAAVSVVSADHDWFDLERGLQVRFPSHGYYRSGDYWLIPTRAATGDVEWPVEADGKTRSFVGPFGVKHHRAALAGARKTGAAWNVERCGCVHKPICG